MNAFISQIAELRAQLLQSCLTLCDPMDYSLPGSSVHGIFQARILEWVAISSSRGVFLTQGSNPSLLCLLHWRWILHLLSHWGSPNKSQELLLAIHQHCQSLSENICLLILDPGTCPPQFDLFQTVTFCSIGQFCIKMDIIRMIVVVMSLLVVHVCLCLFVCIYPYPQYTFVVGSIHR